MAFVPNNLAVLAYAAGFTLWSYATAEDGMAAVQAPGYFDDARAHLRPDDLILLNAADGAAILRVSGHDGLRLRTAALAATALPPDLPPGAILHEGGYPILDEAGAPILQG